MSIAEAPTTGGNGDMAFWNDIMSTYGGERFTVEALAEAQDRAAGSHPGQETDLLQDQRPVSQIGSAAVSGLV